MAVNLMAIYCYWIVDHRPDPARVEMLHEARTMRRRNDEEMPHMRRGLRRHLRWANQRMRHRRAVSTRDFAAPIVIAVEPLQLDPEKRSLQFIGAAVDAAHLVFVFCRGSVVCEHLHA